MNGKWAESCALRILLYSNICVCHYRENYLASQTLCSLKDILTYYHIRDFMCYTIAGEGTLVAGQVNTAFTICFTAEMTHALETFIMGSLFNYSVQKTHLFQLMCK